MRDDLTVIYYTSNKEQEAFEKKIRDRLLVAINGLPLVSVSQKPLESFGTNIYVGDVGASYFNLFKQLYLGCKAAKTKFICTTEADCLYPPTGYFDFVPEDESGVYFYKNLFVMRKGENCFRIKDFSLCAVFANREKMVKSLEGYVGKYANSIWKPYPRKFNIPFFDNTEGMKPFTNDIACINFRTGCGTSGRRGTSTGSLELAELPYWGKAADLQKEMFTRSISQNIDTLKYILDAYGVKKKPKIKLYCSRIGTLPKLFKELGFKTGAEVGTGKGYFSKAICAQCPDVKLYSVDDWMPWNDITNMEVQKMFDRAYEKAVMRLSGLPNNEIIKGRSMDTIKKFKDESLDFVFINTAHDYKSVSEDIKEWSKKIRKGGIICGNNYTSPQELKSLGNFSTGNYVVKKAVNTWVKKKKIKPLFILAKEIIPSWMYVKV